MCLARGILKALFARVSPPHRVLVAAGLFSSCHGGVSLWFRLRLLEVAPLAAGHRLEARGRPRGSAWAPDCKLSSRGPGLGCPGACGISRTRPVFPHWQAQASPLDHQGSPLLELCLVFVCFLFRNNFQSITRLRYLIPNAKKKSSDSSKFPWQDRRLLWCTYRAPWTWQRGFTFPSHSFTYTCKQLEKNTPCPDQKTANYFPSEHLLFWKGKSYYILHAWGMNFHCLLPDHEIFALIWRVNMNYIFCRWRWISEVLPCKGFYLGSNTWSHRVNFSNSRPKQTSKCHFTSTEIWFLFISKYRWLTVEWFTASVHVDLYKNT